MSWTIEHKSDLGIIVVTCSGHWTPEVDMDMLSELKSCADMYRCSSLLVDHRESNMDFEFMPTFKRPGVYDTLHFSKETRGALVWKKIVKDHLFFENVCVNRGYNIKVFDNYDRAVEWLISERQIPD
jgi:hypothetical protein